MISSPFKKIEVCVVCFFIKQKGFSLLELVVAMAISAILVCVAYPVYAGYQASGYRQRAEVILMQLSARMADYALENGDYRGVDIKSLIGVSDQKGVPYRFQLSVIGKEHFLLRAIPNERQRERDQQCGALGLTDANVRSAEGGVAACWQ